MVNLCLDCDEPCGKEHFCSKHNWVKIGYSEDGALVQVNELTRDIRHLTEWCEIFETPLVIPERK